MAKDPAVLLYTQDFLIGVSLLTATQKGHYITLLCHQQQSETGSLLLDDIMTLLGRDYAQVWPVLKKKFKEDENGFYNVRMRSEIARRKKSSDKQKERVGKRWAHRGNTTEDTTVYTTVIQDTGNTLLETEIETERSTEGGTGETTVPPLIPQMLNRWMDVFPRYPANPMDDFTSLRLLAEKIQQWLKLPGQIIDADNLDPIVHRWGEMVAYVGADGFLSKYSISQVNKYFQTIAQGLSNSNGSHQQVHTAGSTGAGKAGTSQARIDALRSWGND